MTLCPKCGNQLDDGTRFCNNCGAQIPETVICPNCGRKTNKDSAFCENCGAAVNAAPAEPVTVTAAPAPAPAEPVYAAPAPAPAPAYAAPAPAPAPAYAASEPAPAATSESAPAAPESSKKLPKKAIIFGVAGVAAVAIIAVIIALIAGGGKKSKNVYDMYIKDEEIFMKSDKNKGEPMQLTSSFYDDDIYLSTGSRLAPSIYFSEDGKYVFYPDKMDLDDDGLNLFYKPVNKPDTEGVKIDSEIMYYYVSSDSNLVTYIKGDDGDLYQYNIKKETKDKIASEVVGSNFRVSDDGKKFIYLNDDYSLYVKEADKDKEKVASDISSLRYVSEDLSTVYYIKDETLYKHVIGKDKEKIADDIYSVIKIYDSGEVYYTTEDDDEISLIDYVDDDMAKADAAITQPEYPDYPDSPDYPYWFDYDTDEEYDAAYEEYEKAYEKYEEECDKLDEAYYAARDAYWEKLDRDDIREDLEDETFECTVYSFYYYDGEKSTVLTESATDSDSYDYASDTPLMIYSAYSQSDVEKVKLSEIDSIYSIYDVEDMVEDALYSSSEYYIAVKGTATAVKAEDEARSFRISSDGSLIYYLDNYDEDEYTGDLFRISVSKGKLGKAEKYDSDVYAGAGTFLDNSSFVYFKEYKNEKGELYVDKKKIDFDVSARVLPLFGLTKTESGEIYYFTDYDEDKWSGTLKVYNGKESTKIADDVAMYDVTPDGRVLYICDYSDKHYTGELYEWNGKEAAKIDDDVSCIIPAYMISENDKKFSW